LRNEITTSNLCYVDDRHKPFHHSCQFACSFLVVVPRQKDDKSSKAGPKPVHREVHLVAQPVGLANEGLIRVLPIKTRSWPYNASLNEYRVADLTPARKTLLERQDVLSSDMTRGEEVIEREILVLKIQYADAEIAQFLALTEGEKVVVYRERLRRVDTTIVAIQDMYFPFWFADVLPELEQREHDISQLMRHVGKFPATCTETVEVVQASSIARLLFEFSPDDPAPLLHLQRHTFDQEAHPLCVQFLTRRGDRCRLHYSFSVALAEPPASERRG